MARGVRQRIGLSAELGFWNGREKAQKAQKNVGLGEGSRLAEFAAINLEMRNS
jgi:hypothetical protein